MTDLPRLKTLSVFRQPAYTMGLPRGVFIALTLAAVLWSLILAWWLGPLLFVVAYPPLLRAHEADPNALAVWVRALSGSPDAIRVDPDYRTIHWE
ncbi:MAG: VirB3 family type IV secretion system protein [Vicinamibacterales bacterium]